MKFAKPVILLINIVIALVGVILIVVGNLPAFVSAQSLFEAIGTSLIAAGGVNFLDRVFNEQARADGTTMAAAARVAIPRTVFSRKYKAEKVDLVGVSLLEALQEIVNDPNQGMINRVLFEHVRLRLIFSHPLSSFITQRALEDNTSKDSLVSRQKESVTLAILFYKRLCDRYEMALKNGSLNPRRIGSVEIKLLDFCPHITIDRADDEIYWGLYMSHTTGLESPMFVTSKEENYALYDHLKQHFDSLLKKNLSSSDSTLVRMVVGPPSINREMVESILGKEQSQMLLP
jgi:hypothetical protein